MTSYPLMQSSLSETQEEFMRFVERHLGPNDVLYQADGDSGLPGDTVRIRMTTSDADADVSERRHVVEFMSLTPDGHWQAVGCIAHSLKEIEAMQGRYSDMESRFEITGARMRDGRFARAEVEAVVRAQLERLKATRLLPLASMYATHDLTPLPHACAA